jgi:hypothetical protein
MLLGKNMEIYTRMYTHMIAAQTLKIGYQQTYTHDYFVYIYIYIYIYICTYTYTHTHTHTHIVGYTLLHIRT